MRIFTTIKFNNQQRIRTHSTRQGIIFRFIPIEILFDLSTRLENEYRMGIKLGFSWGCIDVICCKLKFSINNKQRCLFFEPHVILWKMRNWQGACPTKIIRCISIKFSCRRFPGGSRTTEVAPPPQGICRGSHKKKGGMFFPPNKSNTIKSCISEQSFVPPWYFFLFLLWVYRANFLIGICRKTRS